MTAHRRTLRALERIVLGLEELDASFRSLPPGAKDLIDRSALQQLDAAGVRKLAKAVEDIVADEPDDLTTYANATRGNKIVHRVGSFEQLDTVTDRVLDDVRRHMAAKRQAAVKVSRAARPPLCIDCGADAADLPSKRCPGCQAYREHQA